MLKKIKKYTIKNNCKNVEEIKKQVKHLFTKTISRRKQHILFSGKKYRKPFKKGKEIFV